MHATRWVWAVSLLVSAGCACAEDKMGAEEVAVLEVGAAASRSWSDHVWSRGPTAAVEVTPIEHWLELEAGVTAGFGPHRTEWATDLLFKKPWTLSGTVEFMAGVGPEWIHTSERGTAGNSVAGEGVLDLMFWPRGWKRKFGYYVEPGFEYQFGRGHERSMGVSFGLLIAIRK